MPDHSTRGDWKSFIRSRLVALRLPPARESEIAEELAQHLEDRWPELMAKGATPDDAAQTARTEFSGARLEALLGTLRQAHWHEPPPPGPSRAFSFDSILLDLRHASRALRATPSFTIGALLVLALGTGATTAIFSVADAVALRPLPFPEPDRIVAVGVRAARPSAGDRSGQGLLDSGEGGPCRAPHLRSRTLWQASPLRTTWTGRISNRPLMRWQPSAASATTSFNPRAPNRNW